MSFSAQTPGSICFTKYAINENQVPSAGGTTQRSCYSFVEKISGIANPVSLQHDVMYANAFAGVIERNDLSENETPLALGCVGHQPDKEFPLESKSSFPLPLIMYPTETSGYSLCEVDMCAKPVLNWEEYIQDLKGPRKTVKAAKGKRNKTDLGGCEVSEDIPVRASGNSLNVIPEETIEESTMDGSNILDNDENTLSKSRSENNNSNREMLSIVSWRKLKNQPVLRIEGTWNHLYGGHNGACSFMKVGTSKKLHLFLGKGSQLRAVELNEASPSSIFSLSVDSVWEDEQDTSNFNTAAGNNRDPFNELIFQIVPNESNALLGIRRGRCIQVYNVEDDTPVLLETVPNILYGTSQLKTSDVQREQTWTHNPLLRGFDFNPTFGPEIISIDENEVVRVCNICKESTSEIFALPNLGRHALAADDYPGFKLNDAIGIEFANFGQLFYAWGNSVVYLGDRRPKKYSRSHISPLFDLRNHVHSIARSSQNRFHEATAQLNEYISCLRKSSKDPYYYVGTTSKIYLMDLRVPSHPVVAVNHGLQSPLTYMNISMGKEENFETIVAGSQRSSETVCMISDLVHLECVQRPGCKGRNPLLYCYPKHLLNPRSYFDTVINEGYDFPYPDDNEQIKRHFYAWPTGLAVYPANTRGDLNLPAGMIVATSNNFGDVFWQEWDQKPIPSHRKTNFADYKLKSFVSEWHKAMMNKVPEGNVKKSSKNPKTPTDCTILMEPLTKEIENLTRVRASQFNCFIPHQIQNHNSMAALIPVNELCDKLSNYKSLQVKGMLDVWRTNETVEPETITLEGEQLQVKTEPQDYHIPPSPTGTIPIDLTDNEEDVLQSQEDEHIDNTLQNALSTNEGISSQWSEVYSDFFENSQPLNPNDDDDVQDLYSIQAKTLSSTRSVKKSRKPKRSGFL